MEEADNIARPANGDRGGAKCIFEDQVPADDPGDELAHGRIGIGVGTAGNRDGRGHLRVAKTGKGAGYAAKHEGKCDCRTGIGGCSMAGEHEDARADDAADTERDQAPRRKRALQGHAAMGYQGLGLGLFGFGLEYGHRFSGKDIRHVPLTLLALVSV